MVPHAQAMEPVEPLNLVFVTVMQVTQLATMTAPQVKMFLKVTEKSNDLRFSWDQAVQCVSILPPAYK